MSLFPIETFNKNMEIPFSVSLNREEMRIDIYFFGAVV
jgi:hypothetical protein